MFHDADSDAEGLFRAFRFLNLDNLNAALHERIKLERVNLSDLLVKLRVFPPHPPDACPRDERILDHMGEMHEAVVLFRHDLTNSFGLLLSFLDVFRAISPERHNIVPAEKDFHQVRKCSLHRV